MAEEEEPIFGGGGDNEDVGGDEFQETETEGCGARCANSIVGVGIGVLLLLGSMGAMIWNESNLVQARKALDESEKVLVELPSLEKADPRYEGEMVHFSGKAQAGNAVVDSLFGVELSDTLRLQRSVEMYQWVQRKRTTTKKNLGGSKTRVTTYSYSKQWVDYFVDSSNFARPSGHENPDHLSHVFGWYTTMNAKPITMGAYTLSDIVVEEIENFEPISDSSVFDVDKIPGNTKADFSNSKMSVFQNKGFYVGTGTDTFPYVGDFRVTYTAIPEKTISVVALLEGKTFGEYSTKNGRDIVIVDDGVKKADAMFEEENDEVTQMAWIIRGICFVAIWFGFLLLVEPLSVFADIIPILGDLVDCMAFVVTGLLAACLWLVVVAIAWLVVRPVFSLCLFGGIGLIFVGLRFLKGGGGNKSKGGYEEISLTQDPEATKPSYTDAVVA